MSQNAYQLVSEIVAPPLANKWRRLTLQSKNAADTARRNRLRLQALQNAQKAAKKVVATTGK